MPIPSHRKTPPRPPRLHARAAAPEGVSHTHKPRQTPHHAHLRSVPSSTTRMRERTLRVVLGLLLATWFLPASHAQARGPVSIKPSTKHMLGCWRERSKKKPTTRLIFNLRSSYHWKGKFGLWKQKGNQLWMLGKRLPNGKRMGVLWRVSLERRPRKWMTLYRPEEFIYMGRGRYIYMRFRSPKTTRTFRFEKRLRPCLQDFLKRQKKRKHTKARKAPTTGRKKPKRR